MGAQQGFRGTSSGGQCSQASGESECSALGRGRKEEVKKLRRSLGIEVRRASSAKGRNLDFIQSHWRVFSFGGTWCELCFHTSLWV